MKSKFSNSWVSSKQVRKQRKFRYNAPLHIRHSFLNAHLSQELRKKYGKRSMSIRKGDEVLIMRGNFSKKTGKIIEVDKKKNRVVVENINRTKKDGTKVNVYHNPSNLSITNLVTDDSRRIKRLKVEKSQEKPKEEKNASDKK